MSPAFSTTTGLYLLSQLFASASSIAAVCGCNFLHHIKVGHSWVLCRARDNASARSQASDLVRGGEE